MESSVWMLRRVGVNSTPILLKAGMNSVGRSINGNNIVCHSIWVSRNHCDINMKDGTIFIRDRGSFNGTYLETSRIESQRFIELKKGEHISLGKPYTNGEIISKDHYVFEVCLAPQSSSMKTGPVKRRSASPIHEPAKRHRCTPSQKKVSPENIELIDLTSEDPLEIKIEYTFSQLSKDAAQKNFISANSCLPANPWPNSIGNVGVNDSFVPEIQPLANSTFINGERNAGNANIDDPVEKFLVKMKGKNCNEYLKSDVETHLEVLKNEKQQNSTNVNMQKQLPMQTTSVSSIEMNSNVETNSNQINNVAELSMNLSPVTKANAVAISPIPRNIANIEEERAFDHNSNSNHAILHICDSSDLNVIPPECPVNSHHGSVVPSIKENPIGPIESFRNLPLNKINENDLCSRDQLIKQVTPSTKDCSTTFVNKIANGDPVIKTNSVISSPKTETRIIYKDGGVIRKGAKRNNDCNTIVNSIINFRNKTVMANTVPSDMSNPVHLSNKSELNKNKSTDSSGEDFLGFSDVEANMGTKNICVEEELISRFSCSSKSLISSSKDTNIKTFLNLGPNKCNRINEPQSNVSDELIGAPGPESSPKQQNSSNEKVAVKEPSLGDCNLLSSIISKSEITIPETEVPILKEYFVDDSTDKTHLIPEPNLGTRNISTLKNLENHALDTSKEKIQNSINAAKRIKRSSSSFDAKDVEKLLNDLEKSSDATDSPVQTALLISQNSVQKCPEVLSNETKKSVEISKNICDEYETLEKELKNVVGETSEDSSHITKFSKSPEDYLQKETPSKCSIETEIIDVDSYDQNNSFSQGGTDSIIEIDENDEAYSQIFNDEENNMNENEIDMKPMLLCSRIIKVEVDEVMEDAGLEHFESHFSQCSQEVNEDLLDEIRPSRRFENKEDEDRTLEKERLLDKSTKLDKGNEGHDLDTQEKKINDSKELIHFSNDLEMEQSVSSCNKSVDTYVEPSLNTTKSRKTLKKPSLITSITENKKNLKLETKTLDRMEELSGAKLVKSTLLSKPPETPMKRGRKRKEETSVTKEAIQKKKQQEIKLERNARLKKLALNKSPDINSGINQDNFKIVSDNDNEANLQPIDSSDKQNDLKTDSNENGTDTRKVAKITERNRSTILLEGFLKSKPEGKKYGRTRSKDVFPDSLEKSEICKRNELINKKLKGCLKSPNIPSSHKKSVTFNLQPKVKSFVCEGNLNPINTYASKGRSILPPNAILPRDISSDEFIINVLHWNTSWRKESKNIKGDPPLYQDIFNTKDLFVSYLDYKRWLYPLLLYELWANMMKQIDETEALKSTRTFKGVILLKEPRRSSNNKLLTLKCCVPLLGKDIPKLIDPMDILLLYVSNAAKKFLVMYGIVMSQVKVCSVRDSTDLYVRSYLAKMKFKPDVCAYFDVVIYNSPTRPVETGFNIMMQPLYNMNNEIRQYESLIKLQYSPLLWTILDPENNGIVFLSKDINDKIISTYPLNEEQKRAILCISQTVFSNKPSISLVQGPPGTGKTRVIVALVEQLLYRFKSKNGRRQRILLCAQSNTAIDEICLRLLEVRRQLPREKRFKLCRYGRKERINTKLSDILTTSIARNEVEKSNLDETFRLELSLLKAQEKMISQSLDTCKATDRNNFKRKYDAVQAQINNLQPVVEKTATEEERKKEIDRLVCDEELRVIFHSDIVATTLGSCTSRRLLKAFNTDSGVKEDRGEIGVCIIDEAAQSTDLTTLLPLLHDVKNFILVGDPQQLPPVVNSETCKKNGLSRSLFSRLHKVWSGVDPSKLPSGNTVPVYKLTSQYRMHPEIAQFPSLNFYNNELVTPSFLNVNRGFKPYALFTHKHFSDASNVEVNQKEAELLIDIVDGILKQILFKGLSIGIIVPYQKQRTLVSSLVHDKKWMRLVSVSTIDSYQGQEKDIIILTSVRTNGVGFLSDYQRLNVALTRAKRALYVVGNFSSLMGDPFWKSLFNNAQTRGVLCDLMNSTSAKDFMDFVIADKRKKRSR